MAAGRLGVRTLRAAAGVAGDVSERAIAPLGLLADEIPNQRAALKQLAHRPWPLPERPWLQGQTWNDLLFAHWRVEPAAVEPLIPPPLRLDLYEGHAWLGITPFLLSGARPRGVPPLPWLSRFPELNVRTYVDFAGKPGIYFFSLDAARLAAVAAARRSYRLPYFHAQMQAHRRGDTVHYHSRRIDRAGPPAEFRAAYRPAGPRLPQEDGSLPRWFAERYCAYVVDEQHRVLRADIHHRPWPLQPATAEIAVNTMVQPLRFELDESPLLHYSVRQDTVIWRLEPVGT